MGATTLQSTSLKVLACNVLRRNQGRNSAATSQKSECHFSAEIDPPPATSANAAEICRGCSRLEVVEIFGKPVAGCLYVASGHYDDGWKRLSSDLQKCLHEKG